MLYVTDTQPFLWYLTEDKRLWEKAKDIFEQAETGKAIVVIPTIVLAESFYIARKKNFSIEFKDIVNKVEDSLNFPPFSLDMEVIKEMEKLDGLSELHDKIIVATARMLNVPLITKDTEIKKNRYTQIL